MFELMRFRFTSSRPPWLYLYFSVPSIGTSRRKTTGVAFGGTAVAEEIDRAGGVGQSHSLVDKLGVTCGAALSGVLDKGRRDSALESFAS